MGSNPEVENTNEMTKPKQAFHRETCSGLLNSSTKPNEMADYCQPKHNSDKGIRFLNHIETK